MSGTRAAFDQRGSDSAAFFVGGASSPERAIPSARDLL
jgi:hypothetical protein